MTIKTMAKQALLGALAFTLVAGATAAPASAAPADGSRSTFVVVLHDHVDPQAAARDMARRYNGNLRFVYEHALRGFAITVADEGANGISRDRRVHSVERDQLFRTTAQDQPTGIKRTFASGNASLDIDSTDDARVDVDIAIIDTGLDSDHPDLNIAGGTNCASGTWRSSSCTDGTFEDGNGHGTHVGGSAAALDNGVGVVGMAPGARLHGVKVLSDSGSGYTSWIIAGIDWVTARADVIEVANMSLGCECSSSAQDTAIANSVAKGVTYAVAAGNSDKDSATFSPANHPDVITVSALADFNGAAGGLGLPTCRTDQDDTLADFSNFGADVEIAAPGVCILSTWYGGGYHTISGTSMASPHVAGAAALLASTRTTMTKADTVAIKDHLVAAGNMDWTDDSGDGVTERLLDVSDTTVFAPAMLPVHGGAENAAPSAAFTSSCTDLACSFDGTTSSDSDGTISSYAWAFGDGGTGAGSTTSHSYAAGGTYTVILTVTDDRGATGTASHAVTVTAPSGGGISLSAKAYKIKGDKLVDLTWAGATSTSVDVYRDGKIAANTANDGNHTDTITTKGGGSYTYKVCEAGRTICSPEVTVTF